MVAKNLLHNQEILRPLAYLFHARWLTTTLIESNNNEHGGIRTPDPQDRNLMLYPLSYMPSFFREYSIVGKAKG